LVRRHLAIGWLGLAVFLTLGIALEVFHGLKLDFYLDLRNGPRRMLWTLAHTHGTLFSLMSLAFAWTTSQVRWSVWLSRASYPLNLALLLMPSGFFLGGTWLHGGDPNLAILLVPVGAALLLLAVLFIILALRASSRLVTAEAPAKSGRRGAR
jgi:hypothetical protein